MGIRLTSPTTPGKERLKTETRTALFEFAILTHALEQNEPDILTALYADDAERVVVNPVRPPALIAFWRDVYSRQMAHRVGERVVGPERIAFVVECVYPDGYNILSAMTLDLWDGRIVRHLTIRAWDEVSCWTG